MVQQSLDEKQICELYEKDKNLTIRDLALKVGSSYETIRKILLKNKIKPHRNYVSDLTEKQIQELLEKFDKDQNIKALHRWYQMPVVGIKRLLKFHGRKIPPSSDRKYDILRQTSLSKQQMEFIVGTVLGDGCLYSDGKSGLYKLSFSHQEKHKEYFDWKVLQLSEFINATRRSVDKRGNSVMLQTATICHQDYSKFAKMFYPKNRIKVVPKNLDLYLTPFALAVLIMDDGNLNEGVNMRLCTHGFTKQDNEELQSYFKKCFDLNSKVVERKKPKAPGQFYYYISFNKENTQKLSDLIRPFVVPCMQYKLMPEIKKEQIPASSTTIC